MICVNLNPIKKVKQKLKMGTNNFSSSDLNKFYQFSKEVWICISVYKYYLWYPNQLDSVIAVKGVSQTIDSGYIKYDILLFFLDFFVLLLF